MFDALTEPHWNVLQISKSLNCLLASFILKVWPDIVHYVSLLTWPWSRWHINRTLEGTVWVQHQCLFPTIIQLIKDPGLLSTSTFVLICLVDALSCQYPKLIIHVNHKKPKLVTDYPNIHHLAVKIYWNSHYHTNWDINLNINVMKDQTILSKSVQFTSLEPNRQCNNWKYSHIYHNGLVLHHTNQWVNKNKIIINRTPSTSHSRLLATKARKIISTQHTTSFRHCLRCSTYAVVCSAVIHSCTYFISHPAEGTVCTAKSASCLTFQMDVFIHGGHRVFS